jgi:hypothetical protein
MIEHGCMCGLTKPALAMRESSLVEKWVEVVRDERLIGVKPDQISDAI